MVDFQKKALIQKWIAAHAPNNSAPIFINGFEPLKLNPEADQLLTLKGQSNGYSLYIVCIGDPSVETIPVYIGKSQSVLKRWKNGHVKKLNEAYQKSSNHSYRKWIEILGPSIGMAFIICLNEDDIRFPPIPDFPTTIGSIEYQLVALAADAFPGYVLNLEGKSR
jgi:hypothetical protein